jgi:hypothetical protein
MTVNANPNTSLADRNYVLHNQVPVWVLVEKFDRPLTLTLREHCHTLNHYRERCNGKNDDDLVVLPGDFVQPPQEFQI